jgi:hypothetical protein
MASSLVGGVGRGAEFTVDQITFQVSFGHEPTLVAGHAESDSSRVSARACHAEPRRRGERPRSNPTQTEADIVVRPGSVHGWERVGSPPLSSAPPRDTLFLPRTAVKFTVVVH